MVNCFFIYCWRRFVYRCYFLQYNFADYYNCKIIVEELQAFFIIKDTQEREHETRHKSTIKQLIKLE